MVELLLSKGVELKRTHYFPNWVDISAIKPIAERGNYRLQLGIAETAVVVLFSGSLGGKQGLMVIPEVASLLAARHDIVFLVCGDGVMKPQLQAATSNSSNVRYLPLQPLERLGELLSTADVHLLPQSSDAADLVLPSKLSGMLASGRPVIATCHAGTELDAVVSKCGLVVRPQDPEALAAAICKLTDEPLARAELGRRARAYAEANFERDAILGRIFGAAENAVERLADDAIA
jgi:colanic acid biosynthesis glycosyl transferase WcaI